MHWPPGCCEIVQKFQIEFICSSGVIRRLRARLKMYQRVPEGFRQLLTFSKNVILPLTPGWEMRGMMTPVQMSTLLSG